jgi:hypothetical protein
MRRWLSARKLLVFAGVAVVAATVPLVVLAASDSFGGNLERQTARWTSNDATTSSTEWRGVPGLALTRCMVNQVTALVSVTVEGAEVRFRVIQDGVPENPFKPTSVRFVPNGVESFSFAFVGNTAPFEADDTHRINVQWRSPTGAPVTIHQRVLTLLYERGNQGCP